MSNSLEMSVQVIILELKLYCCISVPSEVSLVKLPHCQEAAECEHLKHLLCLLEEVLLLGLWWEGQLTALVNLSAQLTNDTHG
jgi:hypothetical protein